MTNPLQQLKTQGQSVWYDHIDRARLISGAFKRLLDQDGISGVTSNPTIFGKDISFGQDYQQLHQAIVNQASLDLMHVQADEIRVKGRRMTAWIELVMMLFWLIAC